MRTVLLKGFPNRWAIEQLAGGRILKNVVHMSRETKVHDAGCDGSKTMTLAGSRMVVGKFTSGSAPPRARCTKPDHPNHTRLQQANDPAQNPRIEDVHVLPLLDIDGTDNAVPGLAESSQEPPGACEQLQDVHGLRLENPEAAPGPNNC